MGSKNNAPPLLHIFLAFMFFVTFASFSLPGLAQQTTTPEPASLRELKSGPAIEREIKGGEAHSYRITLSANQYVKVQVEQKGADVVVKLFGPDTNQITEVDGPTGVLGSEQVSAIADVAAEYKLEVIQPNKDARTGHYEIKILELHEATQSDRQNVAAQRTFEEGMRLSNQKTAESRRKAIQKYKEALTLWHSLQNVKAEADTLVEIGVNHSILGDTKEALEYYSRALPIFLQLGDHSQEAITLNNIGMVHLKVGELNKALDYFGQSLPLKRVIVDRRGEATTLGNIAVTYSQMGELQLALEAHLQALAIWKTIGDQRGEALALGNIGVVYSKLGERDQALEYYQQALPLRRSLKDRIGEGTTLYNVGVEYLALRQLSPALDYLNQSLPIRREVGDRIGEAYSLKVIGAVYFEMGESQKALDYYTQALALAQATGDRTAEAVTLSNFGDTYVSLQQTEKALEYFTRALQISRTVGNRTVEASTLRRIALVEQKLGHLDKARTQIEPALDIIESTRSKVISQELRTSFSSSARNYYDLYIDILMGLHRQTPAAGYDAVALQTGERARARSLLDILAESKADIRQGVDPELLERRLATQRQINAKADRLTRLLGGKHTEEQEKAARLELEGLLSEYHQLEEQIRARSPRYAALMQPQPLGLKEIQQVLNPETLLLEYSLGDLHSYLWAVTPTGIKSFALPGRIEIETKARAVYAAITARNEQIKFERPEAKKQRVAEADARYITAATELSKLLLGPVANQLERKRLLIVADGALQYISFGALPVPDVTPPPDGRGSFKPLLVTHEIVDLPSVSTLASLRNESAGRQRGEKLLAVLADPVFGPDDPRIKLAKERVDVSSELSHRESRKIESDIERSAREVGDLEFRRLPFSRQEAASIAAFTPKTSTTKLLDFDANRAMASETNLGNYRIIHFATHGLVNSQHPELSGIVLSLVDRNGVPQDGFLRLHDIYNLRLKADLVVLSGCKTALGKDVKGEGLIGLTRGFMYAGAPRVIASLWAVDDEVTAELMKRFYREMLVKHLRPAAALRAAQVSLWSEQRLPPYYWSAFVLQGDWN